MTIRKEMLMHTKIDPNVRKMVTIILLVSTFISLMSQTMMITALPVIQHDVHRSLNTVQWLTTGYTLMIGVITPLSSNLYERFTNRQAFLGTLGTFSAGGMLMSFQMTTMISIYPPEKRGSILGLSSLVIAAGPAIGPSTAGLILQFLNWHYLFILVLPFMVLAWVLGYFMLPNYSTPQPIHIDFFSVVISLIGSALTLGS